MKDYEILKNTISKSCKISSYDWKSVLIRMLMSTIFAILIIQYVVYALVDIPTVDKGPYLSDYIIASISFIIMRELLIGVDKILERILPIPQKMGLRLFMQITCSITVALIIIKLAIFIADDETHREFENLFFYLAMALSAVFVVFISSSALIVRILGKWMNAQEDVEILKEEKMKHDYNALQDQLNPHFLFNNLSVLKSMIIYDKDAAIEFTEKFTDVYRYVLQSKDKMLVDFKDEIIFINAFIGIHKDRFGDGLDVKVSVNMNFKNYEIAPLSLQLLVENAIKHNIASLEKPLRLRIFNEDDYVVVENTINLKETSYSTHTGLNNLLKRYSYLTKKEVIIDRSDEKFVVKLPLLKKD